MMSPAFGVRATASIVLSIWPASRTVPDDTCTPSDPPALRGQALMTGFIVFVLMSAAIWAALGCLALHWLWG
jgi:hypothetical protein